MNSKILKGFFQKRSFKILKCDKNRLNINFERKRRIPNKQNFIRHKHIKNLNLKKQIILSNASIMTYQSFTIIET